MTFKTLTAAAVILAVLPVAGFSQSARPAMPTLDFATADADGNGGISAAEWQAYTATLMQGMMAERIGTRADALIASGDANADGALTRDELIVAMTANAEAMRDGRGQRGEGRGERMRGHHDGERGMRGHHGEGRGERDDDRRGDRDGMRGHGGMDQGRGFARIDDNNDGAISPEELAQAQAFMSWMAQRPGRN